MASRETGLSLERIIDFSSSIIPFGPSKKAIENIQKSLELIHAYPYPYAEVFIQRLAIYHSIPAECILAGNGSTELIYLISLAMRPRRVLLIEPIFSEYRRILRQTDTEIGSFILKEEDGFLPNINLLKKTVANGHDCLVVSNPNSPAGAIISREKILEIISECERKGITLIVDEAFIDFEEKGSIKDEVRETENLIILRSMTKFFSIAGLRLGYLIGSRQKVEFIKNFLPPWSVNSIAISAGIGSLEDPDYIEQIKKWLPKERDFLINGLSEICGLHPFQSSANFILVKIEGNKTAADLYRYLFRKGILIRECSDFIGLDNQYFRVSVRTRDDNRVLLENLKGYLSKE